MLREPETAPRRPSLSLSALLVLALGVWASAAWRRGSDPPAAGLPAVTKDPVATELRHFGGLADPSDRVQAIKRLGRVRDPRVTVALMELVRAEVAVQQAGQTDSSGMLIAASYALFEYHIPEPERVYGVKYWTGALMWWEAHGPDVRQRAASLPQ